MKTVSVEYPLVAYTIIPRDGGYQPVRLLVDKTGKVTKQEPVEDPDAWEQAFLALESEIAKKYA